MTKYTLLTAFAERRPIKIKDLSFAVINILQHEDGSSKSFMVTGILTSGKEANIHVRTLD